MANIQIFTRQALCFHPYRPWVGSVTPKKVTETKCSKLDPQKELIDPKMAIKVPKVPTKSFFLHRLSQMSSNEWIITKKLKSETLHPKRVPFHPELPISPTFLYRPHWGLALLDQWQLSWPASQPIGDELSPREKVTHIATTMRWCGGGVWKCRSRCCHKP